MIRYSMLETQLSEGHHTSVHFCHDKFDEELDRGLDLSKYETSITDPRSHFHIHYFNRSNDYMEKKVLDSYNINVNFPVIFFSREIPHRDGFRCAFHLQTLKKLRSPFLRDVVKIIKMFKGNFIDIILAADFTKNGENCLLIEPKNVTEIVSSLEKLLKSKQLTEKIGRNGHLYANSNFTVDNGLELLSKEIQKLLL